MSCKIVLFATLLTLLGGAAHAADSFYQEIFVCTAPWSASLGRTVLTKYQTDPALGYIQLATHSVDAGSTTRGA